MPRNPERTPSIGLSRLCKGDAFLNWIDIYATKVPGILNIKDDGKITSGFSTSGAIDIPHLGELE
jgi:hypothetical protein